MSNYILPIGASNDPVLVGGKAASLARTRNLGLDVPPGIVVTTEYWKTGRLYDNDFTYSFARGVESQAKRKFGDITDPLLVSVRSGAPVSMPGMMDTVLNVGLTYSLCNKLIQNGRDETWVWSTYMRFLTMYADIALPTETQVDEVKACFQDVEWYSAEPTAAMCKAARDLIEDETDTDDIDYVLGICVAAVLKSWNSERAIEYRAMHGIPDDLGTAVTVQQMVFGNAPDTHGPSATGVLFSRDPNTGENVLWGEWLENAQGEDVVAGLRPAMSMDDMTYPIGSEWRTWLGLYDHLLDAANELEREYRDMVDIEWTLENGKLWFLQCRPGKRSPEAAVRIAVDMANEGLVTRDEAVQRAKPVARLLAKQTLVGNPTPIATGDNASYGVASGAVVFSSAKAKEMCTTSPVILVRRMTDPQDVGGMSAAVAVLTQEGGPSSHAAVVARELGKPCVTGASIVLDTIYFEASGKRYVEGDWLTVDGTNGNVYAGKVEFATTNDNPHLATLKEWGL